LETTHEGIVDTHHGSRIVKLAAIIRRGEKGHELTLAEEFVAVFYDLMSSADKVEVVSLAELVNDVLTESEADTAVILAPLVDFLVGITPE
jgi:hypothetical protein